MDSAPEKWIKIRWHTLHNIRHPLPFCRKWKNSGFRTDFPHDALQIGAHSRHPCPSRTPPASLPVADTAGIPATGSVDTVFTPQRLSRSVYFESRFPAAGLSFSHLS